MDNPPSGVATLTAEIEGRRILIGTGEFDAPFHQFAKPVRAFRYHKTDDFFIREACPTGQGVFDVILETVRPILDDGDSALGQIGIRVGFVLLGDHRDGAQLRRLDRKAQTGDAGAQNKKIGMDFHGCLCPEMFVYKYGDFYIYFRVICKRKSAWESV